MPAAPAGVQGQLLSLQRAIPFHNQQIVGEHAAVIGVDPLCDISIEII